MVDWRCVANGPSPQEGSKGLEIAESDRVCLETLGVLPQLAEFRELAAEVGN